MMLPSITPLFGKKTCRFTDCALKRKPAAASLSIRCVVQTIQIPDELYSVEAIEGDRIRVDRVWNKKDVKPILLYKMVLSRRQKLLLK